jgi:Domain of unknown function (DUF4185)
LKPGQVRKIGPVAGTGGADLGEIVTLPDGRKVAIFGDSFTGNTVGAGQHYRSVAVEVTGFDPQGRPIYRKILTGPEGSKNELLSLPDEATKISGVVDTLPAGTVTIGNKTYMMVVGTDKDLKPIGGSWLTEVTNDPGGGWKPIGGSWRAWEPGNRLGGAPTQLSGYQGSDGKVYIAANSFDRGSNDAFHGVRMFRVDPATITDRSTWQPWTGRGWGAPSAAPAPVSPNDFGELSFREINGRPVLSGFDRTTGSVEVRVGGTDPSKIFSAPPTVIAQQHAGQQQAPNYLFHNYGGLIVPGSTLDNLRLLVSKWGDGDYTTQLFQANVTPPK